MSYFLFILRKVIKKKLTIVPFVLISIFIIVMYMGNLNASTFLSNKQQDEKRQIEVLKNDVVDFQNKLNNYEPTSKAYVDTKYNLEIAEQRAKYLQLKFEAYENKNWKVYHEADMKLTDITLKTVESNKENYSDELFHALKLDENYAQYKGQHNLSYDERFAPTQGVSYMINVLNAYSPLILTFLLIFILSNMYCESFVDGMEIHDIIPISKIKKQSIKLMVGVFCGILTLLFLIVLPLACGGLGNSLGSIQSPVLIYTSEYGGTYTSLLSVIPKLLLLSLLSILFIVNFVSIISLITKRNLICLIITLAILLGFIWMTSTIVPLFPFVHMLPTTYFSTLKVISGELMNNLHNTNINFINGVIVLSFSNAILFISYHIGSKISLKKVK